MSHWTECSSNKNRGSGSLQEGKGLGQGHARFSRGLEGRVCGHTASPALAPQELWLFTHAGLAHLVNLEESLTTTTGCYLGPCKSGHAEPPRRPSSTSLSIAQWTLQLCTTRQGGEGRAEDLCRCPQQRPLVGLGLSFALNSAFALESAIQQLACPAIPAAHGTAEPLSGGQSRSFAQAM